MFSLSYLCMVGLMSYCMIQGIKISNQYIDIFQIMTYPILVILGGEFTNNIAEVLKNRPRSRKSKAKVSTEVVDTEVTEDQTSSNGY
ncbi:hypothetical protein SP15_069 [Bacillus phage SP-15]|uniref:Uncharacterized protein n=1 Tax=Bacillus phage SP-15 TaxID=1792032 RepID=A0A127AW45_9CAUD|nr:hypothetical protein SP15_069 [Bacillus phage SP-15]AMM44868.1 hypothetical protein SP15_069 [Bacillus phage SP-15]